MSKALRGSCLCGACKFTAIPETEEAGACHCGMCRKWSGGVFLAVDCGNSVVFNPGSPIGRYRGSDWGERVFCKECGASLMWQTQDGQHQSVSMQAFDDQTAFRLTSEIFVDRKPAGYAFDGNTKKMTEAEVFALYAPQPEEQR